MAMFGKEQAAPKPAARSGGRSANETSLSIVSPGTTIFGDVDCDGVLKVDGRPPSR